MISFLFLILCSLPQSVFSYTIEANVLSKDQCLRGMERWVFNTEGKSIYSVEKSVSLWLELGSQVEADPTPHRRLLWCSWWAPSFFLTSVELSYVVQRESIVETFPSQSGTFPQKASEMESLTKGRKLTGMGIRLYPGWLHSCCCKIHPPHRVQIKGPQNTEPGGS